MCLQSLNFIQGVGCGLPTFGVNMAVVRNEGQYFGDEFEIACNHGYELMLGNETRMCKANKVWSGKMPVCRGKRTVSL